MSENIRTDTHIVYMAYFLLIYSYNWLEFIE